MIYFDNIFGILWSSPQKEHIRLTEQALLAERVVLSLLGSFAFYSLSIPPGWAFASGCLFSLPSALLSAGALSIGLGAHSILNSSDISNFCLNILSGGGLVAIGGALLYGHKLAPYGLVEPIMQTQALSYASTRIQKK